MIENARLLETEFVEVEKMRIIANVVNLYQPDQAYCHHEETVDM